MELPVSQWKLLSVAEARRGYLVFRSRAPQGYLSSRIPDTDISTKSETKYTPHGLDALHRSPPLGGPKGCWQLGVSIVAILFLCFCNLQHSNFPPRRI